MSHLNIMLKIYESHYEAILGVLVSHIREASVRTTEASGRTREAGGPLCLAGIVGRMLTR